MYLTRTIQYDIAVGVIMDGAASQQWMGSILFIVKNKEK